MGIDWNPEYESSGDYELPTAGPHPGRCVHVWDLGSQPNTHPKAKFPTKREIMIVFELADQMEDGRPFTVNERFTLSLGDRANLRKFLEQWRGQAFTEEQIEKFSTEKILGKKALLTITNDKAKNGRTYSNINSIMPLPKEMDKLPEESHNEQFEFSITELGDSEKFDKIWPYVQGWIKDSTEGEKFYATEGTDPASDPEPETGAEEGSPEDDDIPF